MDENKEEVGTEEEVTPVEDNAGTQTAREEEAEAKEEAKAEEPEPAAVAEAKEAEPETKEAEAKGKEEQTLTQSQVNELVGKARQDGRQKGYESAKSELLAKYGVKDEAELDAIVSNGKKYDELNGRFEETGKSLAEARSELALSKGGIIPERQDDVKAILTAKGLEITQENIESLLPTHPEWKGYDKPIEMGSDGKERPIPQPKAQPLGIQPKKDDPSESLRKLMWDTMMQ